MDSDNLMDVLQALDHKVEELVQTVRQLKSERDQARTERDQLKAQLEESKRQVESTQAQFEESRKQQDELTHLVNSIGSDRSVLRERVQAILYKIEQLEG